MTKVGSILFDLDGVLIDAREWHYEALNRALGLFGYEINRLEHLTTVDGLPTFKKLEYLSITKGFPRKLHVVVNELKQEYTKEMIIRNCHPVFVTEYAVSRLRREGYRLAVCSNSIRETMDLMLGRSGLADYFDLTLSNLDVVRPKPDPEIYRTAMARLDVAPDSCLIVEDNQHGIEAATRAGGHLLVVRDPGETTYQNIVARIRDVERA